MEKSNGKQQQDRRMALRKLETAMNELNKNGIGVFIAKAYGTRKPSTYVIIEDTEIIDGRIRELLDEKQ